MVLMAKFGPRRVEVVLKWMEWLDLDASAICGAVSSIMPR